jgi:hypothetical protein
MSGHLALRPELDQLRCAEPGCACDDELVLSPVCHDQALAVATYSGGELRLERPRACPPATSNWPAGE